MPDNTLVEEVARAICEASGYDWTDQSNRGLCGRWNTLAQAAVSIIEQRVRELEEERVFVWKWVERGMFDKHTDAYNALEIMAHYPGAPWKNGRWDVDHKPYAATFYDTFPKAALTTKETDGRS